MPENFTEMFNTPIPKKFEAAFQRWIAFKDVTRKKEGRGSILMDKGSYDIQGAFLSEMKGEEGTYDIISDHYTDRFKKPNHPTFSNESKYHGVSGFFGGEWNGDNFRPSIDNIKMFGVDNVGNRSARQLF